MSDHCGSVALIGFAMMAVPAVVKLYQAYPWEPVTMGIGAIVFVLALLTDEMLGYEDSESKDFNPEYQENTSK